MNSNERKYAVNAGEHPVIDIKPVPDHLGPLHDRAEKCIRRIVTKTSVEIVLNVALMLAFVAFVLIMSNVLGNAHFLATHAGPLK